MSDDDASASCASACSLEFLAISLAISRYACCGERREDHATGVN